MAVVITAADSRSGILALLKRTGFHLPVFLYSEHAVELPAGRYGGNQRQRAAVAGAGIRSLSV
ncbi:Orn/Lys/Arg decarboxylase N-terminal domain-containing protein [Shigella boydii]|uniref:Orn/Lys/Arg decarboxylase N-terminal domain-containing protein n=1 Tax=Shigella boydii TaxID=621 RepID=UPI0021F6766A|nr:Orn/Lys/Arg decarboxylase N-terminal domain-containing protein [Shigella boydii]